MNTQLTTYIVDYVQMKNIQHIISDVVSGASHAILFCFRIKKWSSDIQNVLHKASLIVFSSVWCSASHNMFLLE